MKHNRKTAHRLPGVALAFLLVFSCTRAADSPGSVRVQSAGSGSANSPMPLTPDGKALLRSILDAGNLPDLRWPNFSDYRQLMTDFYSEYGYALPWIHDSEPTPQARAVIAVLLQADSKGLSADDYDGPRWQGRLAKLRPAASHPAEKDAVQFDAALTICLMRYISDLHIGKINPKHFEFGLDIEHKKYDLSEFVQENVVNAADVEKVLAQVEPPYPGYYRLMRAMQKYEELAAQDDGATLPDPKKSIAPGDSYAGVLQLARRLRLVGDLPADATIPADSTTYQGPLVDAVKKFQARHGLDPDGKLGPGTVADLNVPLSRRVKQMQLTLERWRWLPLGEPQSLIVVNIPEFRLRAFDENLKLGLAMNVVVGKAYDHSTPIFEDEMQYAIFRPYWNIPPSIASREILSAMRKNPNYLTKENLEVIDRSGNVVTSGTFSDDIIQQVRGGKLTVRQRPGPKNSLGLVKFIFPNSYNVYMHDTPATQFFAKTRRDFSHGCIRLERPADLAAWVLRNNPGWTPERIRAVMNGAENNIQVNLKQPLPVLIIYATVVVSEDGVVHIYDDIYGHDRSLEEALAKGYPYPS
ncbi:MAG TPA: L,D-transpeptidase family protein [Candidatus Limnocylindrales bacterium]|nr:L,D-transpeptidase family protein [Candidatus Limnocylindrales bacterium]